MFKGKYHVMAGRFSRAMGENRGGISSGPCDKTTEAVIQLSGPCDITNGHQPLKKETGKRRSMLRLVLQGDKNSLVEDEKIIYDIWNGRVRERKMLGRKVIEWSAFTKEELLQIMGFFGKAIKEL